MPVGWAAGFAALGTVAAGAIGADAAKDAARTQGRAADRASQVQLEMFNRSEANQTPFMQSGYGANAELSRLLGIKPQTAMGNAAGTEERTKWDDSNGQLVGDTYLPPGTTTKDVGNGWFEVHNGGQRVGTLRPGGENGRFINDTNWQMPTPAQLGGSSGAPGAGAPGAEGLTGGTGLADGYLSQTFGPEQFKAGMDPGYQWRLQQGAQGVQNTAAAGSGSLSGPALKALMEYGQGAASQEFGAAFDRFNTQQGNIFQRLSSVASLGQNAAAGVGNQGVATGANVGANITGAGNAAAAGQVGAANAYGSALSDLGSLGYLYANRPPSGGGSQVDYVGLSPDIRPVK